MIEDLQYHVFKMEIKDLSAMNERNSSPDETFRWPVGDDLKRIAKLHEPLRLTQILTAGVTAGRECL